MKIEKFLNWIYDKMLNYPNIDFKTLKMFIDKFDCCLSKKERERYALSVQLIKEFSSKQISLIDFVNDMKTENLNTELKNLKKRK